MKYGLAFINDDDLYHHVRSTILKYRFKIDFKKLNENLIDPIKITFDSFVYHDNCDNASLIRILENEIQRQIDKSNTNHIGYFHQNIFNFIGINSGWTVPNQGFDVENVSKKIYVEMKNKHNTMNSSSSAKTYMRMQNKILQEPNATCMLVEVIARNSQNIIWKMKIDGENVSHEKIRRVSIDKFYEIVTGDVNAFADLCKILPIVIQDVLGTEKIDIIQNTVFDDIKKENINHILTSLYLMTFKKYQGFESFGLRLL